jgi:hypothetical protein
MPLPRIYHPDTNHELIKRIDSLHPQSTRLWGKMTVSQMLKHCMVPYKGLLSDKPVKTKTRLLGRLFFKPMLTNEKPFRKNSPTSAPFLIKEEPEFYEMKKELLEKMVMAHEKGETFFEGKTHPFLGKLTAVEWSNMLYKHLDHHLRQFGV